MTTQNAWQALIKQAVVGLERAATDLDEQQLLNQMASLSLRRRAGKTLQRSPLEADESPAEDLKPATGKVLVRLLNHQHQELLLDYLQGLARAKRHLPHDHLVEVLSMARENRIREALLPVLGERGHWLGSQNESWHWACRAESTSWQTGIKAERLQLLRQLRRTNPAQARELIQSTWLEDNASDRSNFVAVLAIGLSLEDEAFLEDTLRERSKQVRSESVGLLASLPTSQLCQRMAARAKNLLSLESRMLKRSKLSLELIDGLDEAMIQDGIQEKPQHKTIGKRAWWTQQILQATPLIWWESQFDKTPAQLITAANNNTEWRSLLLESLEAAALTFTNTRWAKALLDAYLADKLNVAVNHITQLFPLAYNATERDSLLMERVKHSSLLYKDTLLSALLTGHKLWSEELTLEVIKSFDRDLKHIKNYSANIQIYKQFAFHMQAHTAKEALTAMPPSLERANWLDNVVDDVYTVIDLRSAIADELASYQEHP